MFLLMSSLTDESKVHKPTQVDEVLISLIANKDKKALEKLYEQANKAVYAYAYSILKEAEDAHDAMQETFIKVYASAGSYKPMGKPMAWILRITKNLALMKIREMKRISPVDMQEEGDGIMPQAPSFDSNSEYKIILEGALSSLTDESRQIVVLHAIGGLKHREIAEVMDLGLSNVLSKYHRAIKKLKKILEEGSIHE